MSFFKYTKYYNNRSRGYTLLFAVIVSVLVLSIAAFILSVSRKQAILSSSARDSVYAFYAADSALECAVENMSVLSDPNAPGGLISCGGSSNVTYTHSGGGNVATSTFYMPTGAAIVANGTQSGASSCASTTVAYNKVDGHYNGGTYVATSTTVIVIARGYNIGWTGANCSYTGPRKVERALEYVQY